MKLYIPLLALCFALAAAKSRKQYFKEMGSQVVDVCGAKADCESQLKCASTFLEQDLEGMKEQGLEQREMFEEDLEAAKRKGIRLLEGLKDKDCDGKVHCLLEVFFAGEEDKDKLKDCLPPREHKKPKSGKRGRRGKKGGKRGKGRRKEKKEEKGEKKEGKPEKKVEAEE